MSPAPHDLDPPAMTDEERRAKARMEAGSAFELARTVYHSRDGGKHWQVIHPSARSLIGTMAFDPKRPWSDGFGNLYWDRLP